MYTAVKRNDIFVLISKLIGVISLAGFLLYFVGKRYIETYNTMMGIPYQEIRLEFYDYAYIGANPVLLIIVIVFTLLGIGLFRIWTTESRSSKYQPRRKPVNIFVRIRNTITKTPRFHQFNLKQILVALDSTLTHGMIWYVLFVVIFYSFSLPILALQDFFNTDYSQSGIGVTLLTTLAALLFTCGFLIMFFFDKSFLLAINNHRIIKNLMLFAGAFALLTLPYLGAGFFGTTMALYDTRNLDNRFDKVTIISLTIQAANIQWNKVNGETYSNTNPLYLVYSSENSLYLKPDSDNFTTIVIPKNQISSYVIHSRENYFILPKLESDNSTNDQ